MDKYLIDTNVFFELLCFFSARENSKNTFNIHKITSAECYISEITKIEIFSVIGKYARGRQRQEQICDRQIDKTGKRCMRTYYDPGLKKWSGRQTGAMKKMVKDILEKNSPLIKIDVLPVTPEVLAEAERFIQYASRYKFASLDAVIAGTALYYSEKELTVATHDKSLRRAMADAGIPIFL